MEAISELLSWPRLGLPLVVYFVTLVFSSFIHPLSGFPGPKLAAVSRWYGAYYDVVQNGQYTFKITKLHKEYGRYWSAALPIPASPFVTSRQLTLLLPIRRSDCSHLPARIAHQRLRLL